MRGVGTTAGQGSSVGTAVARVTQAYRGISNTTLAGGICRCKGGRSHCSGCEEIPLYRSVSNPKGLDGQKGLDGEKPTDILIEGRAGAEGQGAIVVRLKNGGRMKYDSRYNIQLVDFDIEDENEDGIFEPGEHIFVRRIKVKNAGKYLRTSSLDRS